MEMRSFSDYLRSIDDAAFLSLFTARPDLVTPVPPDIASLAVRACSAPSLARAIDSLNQWQFQVLEAACTLTEPFTLKSLVALTDKAAAVALEHLISVGLIYPSDDGMRLPTQLRDVIGNEPAGLGPVSIAKLKLTELDNAPLDAKKVLERLIWGPPRGSIGDIKNPGPGVTWLLERKFLVPLDQRTVILPREVAIYLRGGKTHRENLINPPVLAGTKRDERQVNLAAIANISTVLRWVEELLNFWAEEPADALRAGGLGVRDLKIISNHLGVDETCTAFITELAYLTSLISVDSDERRLHCGRTLECSRERTSQVRLKRRCTWEVARHDQRVAADRKFRRIHQRLQRVRCNLRCALGVKHRCLALLHCRDSIRILRNRRIKLPTLRKDFANFRANFNEPLRCDELISCLHECPVGRFGVAHNLQQLRAQRLKRREILILRDANLREIHFRAEATQKRLRETERERGLIRRVGRVVLGVEIVDEVFGDADRERSTRS